VSQQPRFEPFDSDQAARADLDALERTGPEGVVIVVLPSPDSRAASPGDTASGSAFEGGRLLSFCMVAHGPVEVRSNTDEHRSRDLLEKGCPVLSN
jgi:hypothetical protein